MENSDFTKSNLQRTGCWIRAKVRKETLYPNADLHEINDISDCFAIWKEVDKFVKY